MNKQNKVKAAPNKGVRRKHERSDPYAGVIAALTYFGVPHTDTSFTCPACGTTSRGKTKIRRDGGLICYKCRGVATGGPVSSARRLAELRMGVELSDRQVALLLNGKDPFGGSEKPVFDVAAVQAPDAEPDVTVDAEVLNALCDYGNLKAGRAWWATHHVARSVVDAYGAGVLTATTSKIVSDLVDRFGAERLVTAGIAKPSDSGNGIGWTVLGKPNDRRSPMYPVLQTYRDLDGNPVGLELRGNGWVAEQAAKHAAGERDFIPKTRNLIGNAKGSRPGFGLNILSRFNPAQPVLAVEGFKDVLAVASINAGYRAAPSLVAVGFAGARAELDARAVEALEGRSVILAFDNDAAGHAGALVLGAKLGEAGIRVADTEQIRAYIRTAKLTGVEAVTVTVNDLDEAHQVAVGEADPVDMLAWPEGDAADYLAWLHATGRRRCVHAKPAKPSKPAA